ncbi:hypothetical protein Lepto7376_3186 [[Leptolyngbya] sp. PCC 7376]|uniref:DUF6816 family protein n=1 Tax=[Leptolyngbya] sp. PCC 7376 TaxID=111781 RepID=UPI00029EF019|nr:hypothetical protein [[Leptolyngbya] sp. PCC 7376]AFY39415.1 hypothetical protein Lepto7376_3186 [[Leptolyngbya] sp. PCC 7376]
MLKPLQILSIAIYLWCNIATMAWAETLQDRIQDYPNWSNLPSVETVQGSEDLIYPDWMQGTWQVSSTLREQTAPLAPEIVTPGFEQNRQFIDQPLIFCVKFEPQQYFAQQAFALPKLLSGDRPIVANREFNGTEIATAYLGEAGLRAVKVDPTNPNRQLTRLNGDRTLISTITARVTEFPNGQEFLSSEITRQQFRGTPQIYLNTVETTTDYTLQTPDLITAKQITAIYLSPNDPNFFQAKTQPVALYLYELELAKIPEANNKADF